jgi:Fe-S cluster assembly ATP-binding protein
LKGISLEVKARGSTCNYGTKWFRKKYSCCSSCRREFVEVTEGTVTYYGKNLLEMSPEDRAKEGIFLGFQYPIEIPGVSMVNFMKTAVNEHRKHKGLEPLSASDFLKMMREKKEMVEIDSKLANRSVNEGFSGGEKKKNEIFQMAMLEPKLAILDETDSGLDIDALRDCGKWSKQA